MSDREIGAAWMRAEEFHVDDKILIMHPRDQTAPHVVTDEDIQLTLRYGPLRFKAYAPAARLTQIADLWRKLLDADAIGKTTDERRSATRAYILDELAAQRLADGDHAYVLAAAALWLAVTAPAGAALTLGSHKAVHWEITDIVTAEGRKGNNFRIALNRTHDMAIPDWVQGVPSPYGKPAR